MTLSKSRIYAKLLNFNICFINTHIKDPRDLILAEDDPAFHKMTGFISYNRATDQLVLKWVIHQSTPPPPLASYMELP